MNNQALTVYLKAEQRFDNGRATKADEVLLSLWDENKELSAKNREMALKISLLELQNVVTIRASATYAALVQRVSRGEKQAPVT